MLNTSFKLKPAWQNKFLLSQLKATTKVADTSNEFSTNPDFLLFFAPSIRFQNQFNNRLDWQKYYQSFRLSLNIQLLDCNKQIIRQQPANDLQSNDHQLKKCQYNFSKQLLGSIQTDPSYGGMVFKEGHQTWHSLVIPTKINYLNLLMAFNKKHHIDIKEFGFPEISDEPLMYVRVKYLLTKNQHRYSMTITTPVNLNNQFYKVNRHYTDLKDNRITGKDQDQQLLAAIIGSSELDHKKLNVFSNQQTYQKKSLSFHDPYGLIADGYLSVAKDDPHHNEFCPAMINDDSCNLLGNWFAGGRKKFIQIQ